MASSDLDKIVAEFIKSHNPNMRQMYISFRPHIVEMLKEGYSKKAVHECLSLAGLPGTYVWFAKWVKENIDSSEID